MGSQLASINIRCHDLNVPSRNGSATMPGLSGSASVKDKTFNVTLTNPSLDSPVTTQIRLSTGSITEGRGTILTHAEKNAANTFDRPNEVALAQISVKVSSNRAEVTIPPRAIVSLQLKMA